MDVSFHRTLSLVVRHIHGKREPDFSRIDQLILKAKEWLEAWEALRQEVSRENWYQSALVKSYFSINIRRDYELMAQLPTKTRAALAEGRLVHFGGTKGAVLIYDPLFFHNADTLELARQLGVSLE